MNLKYVKLTWQEQVQKLCYFLCARLTYSFIKHLLSLAAFAASVGCEPQRTMSASLVLKGVYMQVY